MKSKSNQPFFSLLTNNDTSYRPYSPGFFEKIYTKLHAWRLRHQVNENLIKGLHWASIALLPALGVATMAVGLFTSALGLWGPLIAGAVVTLASSIFGVIQHRLFFETSKKQSFLDKHKSIEPPTLEHPWLKSNHMTFNQLTSFYCDSDHVIWYALRESTLLKPQWKPLFIPDLPLDGDSYDLKADGQNLMVKVTHQDKSKVYYKKVFEDKRKGSSYEVNDLCDSPKGENQWFSLPVVSWLFVNHWGKKLKLDPVVPWAMTHGGELKHTMLDAAGKPFEIWGVTSVFEMTPAGLKIYDPYVPPGTEITVALPPNFCVQQIKGTSSHIFLLGYDRTDPDLQPRLLERLLDYDVLGLNPLIGYTKDKEAKGRVMPLSEWHSVSLPKRNYDWSMTVIHPGKGLAPEVRVQPRHESKGTKGFYFKNLGQRHWHYHKAKQEVPEFVLPHMKPQDRRSFKLNQSCIRDKTFKSGKIDHFSHDNMQVALKLKMANSQWVSFYLFKKTNLILDTLRGHNDFSWTLALAPDSQTEENRAWFKELEGIKVDIEDQDSKLLITGKGVELSFDAASSPFTGWHYPKYKPEVEAVGAQHDDRLNSGNVPQYESGPGR